MLDPLTATVITAALLMAATAGVLALRNRPPGRLALGALAFVEIAVLAQAVVGVVLVAGGQRPDSVATFVGYHVAALLTLPAGVLWALGDRSRWGGGVLAIACLTLAVLTVRLQQIWATAGA